MATMREWEGGRLKEGHMADYPPLNSHRIPLINPPPPQIHRLMDPERLFRIPRLLSPSSTHTRVRVVECWGTRG